MTKYYWHIHHDRLLEVATEPIQNRIEYIKKEKPKEEIELRFKLLKQVKGKLPVSVDKAWKAFDKAREVYDKASEALDKASEALDKAWKTYDKALTNKDIIKLHDKECPDCPWNGRSIFS